MWSKDVFLEFLEIYHKNECLWKIKSKDYYNKTKKKDGYAQLLAKARTVDPNFTEDDVKKKINNFRSSFRKEYKKVTASMVYPGAGASDYYVPKLWYYEQLLFLKDQEEQSEGDSEPENSEAELTEESSLNTPNSYSYKRKRALSPQPQEQVLTTQTNNDIVHCEDSFDIVGRNIAIKLRQLRKDQSIIAEKLINDVMFEAQFNNLNKDAHLEIPTYIPDMSVTTTEED